MALMLAARWKGIEGYLPANAIAFPSLIYGNVIAHLKSYQIAAHHI